MDFITLIEIQFSVAAGTLYLTDINIAWAHTFSYRIFDGIFSCYWTGRLLCLTFKHENGIDREIYLTNILAI